jgi:uncharacterized membrane protein YidH (DUF202 family)
MAANRYGSANERTALAWQRTALSVVGGSAVLTRLTLDRLGAAAVVSVVVGVPLGMLLFVEGRSRYRRRAGDEPPRRGGRAPAALAFVTCVVGLTELVALAVG